MDDGFFDAENWLESFPSHPIFHPPSQGPSNAHHSHSLTNPDRCSRERSGPDELGCPCAFVVINQTDLVVSCGSELRLVSLAKYKASLADPEQRSRSDHYKVLQPTPRSALPGGSITKLVPNPTSRLLAICSDTQVSVISLPRLEEQSDAKTNLECNATMVGKSDLDHDRNRQDSHSAIAHRVMKVLWHEWSHRASTILVLYSSGIAHEYDVSHDAQRPTRIIDFNSPYGIIDHIAEGGIKETSSSEPILRLGELSSSSSVRMKKSKSSTSTLPLSTAIPPRKTRASSKPAADFSPSKSGTYGSADSRSTMAVSMCFGSGTGDWGPLTLYGVMQNGDMYAICPYLPKNAVLPLPYRNSLLLFLTAKLESISQSAHNEFNHSLLAELQAPLYHSLDYLSKMPDSWLEGDIESDDQVGRNLEFDYKPVRQGPFLMQPSPIEINEDEEDTASDLVHFRYSSPSSTLAQSGSAQAEAILEHDDSSVGVFLIAYQSRIDVYLEVEKIEPRWVPLEIDEESARSSASDLPVLLTYECIDLGLPLDDQAGNDVLGTHGLETGRLASSLALVADMRYLDTVYVYHRFGVHAISTMHWLDQLVEYLSTQSGLGNQRPPIKPIGDKKGSEVVWVARTARPEHARRPPRQPRIDGLCVVDDAYLGYGLLAITNDMQLVTQQLRHRPLALPATPPLPDVSTLALEASQPSLSIAQKRSTETKRLEPFAPSAYVSLLNSPWQVPGLLKERPSKLIGPKLKPPSDLSVVNTATVRFAVEASEEIDRHIRRLIEAVNMGQDRLKLQCREYARQLEHVYDAQTALEREQGERAGEPQVARIRRVEETQAMLLQRADQVLQRLTDENNRCLSKEEVKWFAELGRMKDEVEGEGGRKSLGAEIEELRTQLESAKKLFTSINESRDQYQTNLNDSKYGSSSSSGSMLYGRNIQTVGKLGESQVKNIQFKLAQGTSCLALLQQQLSRLSIALSNT